MNSALHSICAFFACAGLIYKLSNLRRAPRDPSLIALCAVLTFSVLSFIISNPTVWLHIDQLLGIPNVSALLAQGCVMGLIVGQQVALAFWVHPPEKARYTARRRLLAMAIVIVALTTLFFLMGSQPQNPQKFVLENIGQTYHAIYLALYLAMYTFGQVETGRLCWRYARVSTQPWLKIGLYITAVGCWHTLVFSAIRSANLVSSLTGWGAGAWGDLAWTFGDIGSLLSVIGWTLPGWGAYITKACNWSRTRVYYYRLHPLWMALYRTAPEIALNPPSSKFSSRFAIRRASLLLYRRVIEIRDGQLALRSYFDIDITNAAVQLGAESGLSREEVEVAIEAAQIRGAIDAREYGLNAAERPEVRSMQLDTLDPNEEVVRLLKVSYAFTHSSITAKAAQAALNADPLLRENSTE